MFKMFSLQETVEEVKTSVNRRMDYVLQVLRSHHVQDFTIHRMLNRTDKLYQMEVEVVVEFSDFSKCEQVCNLLVEKLDDTVKVSVPVMFHTVGRLDTLRLVSSSPGGYVAVAHTMRY